MYVEIVAFSNDFPIFRMLQISDDGIVDVEATIAVLPEEMRDEATPIIKKCGTQSKISS